MVCTVPSLSAFYCGFLAFPDLYDGLAEEYHFFSDFLYYEILDLEPFFILATSGTQLNLPHSVLFIPSGTSYRLMNYVCDKIVGRGRMLLCRAQIVTEVDAFQGEIYDSWVFLFHKVVFCEPLVMDNKIWRKLLTIEPTQLTPRFLRA
jgi:hypothetical protein